MSDARKASLLLVEDEPHLVVGLRLNFELEGLAVVTAGSVREGAAALLQGPFDVIVLDAMLPDGDGFAFCQRLREAGDLTPVLMLTARQSEEDRVRGLEAGADDYLTKPFALAELLARVRALLRRRRWQQEGEERPRPSTVYRFGDAHIDFDAHVVTVREAPIALTQLELDLVRYFAAHEGRVVSRAELVEKVWKLGNYPNTRTVDNFLMRLRRHFENDPAHPRHFLSVRGRGYKFVASPT